MRIKRTSIWMIAAGIAILTLILVGLRTSARQQIAQSDPCGGAWWNESSEIQQRCGQAKQATDDAYLHAEETRISLLPTYTPRPLQTLTPRPQRAAPTPFVIRADDPIEFADGDSQTRGSNSIWIIGVIPSPLSGLDSYLYALARPPKDGRNATLSVALAGSSASEEDLRTYNKFWISPQDVGIITITNVTGPTTSPSGPTGVIYFTTQGGKTGHLTIATGAWTFDP